MGETQTEDHSPALPGLDQFDLVRGQIKGLIASENISIKAAATESGVAYTTLSAFLAGTYAGRNADISAKMQVWLDSRKANKRLRAVMPRAPDFQLTDTASSLFAVLEHAQHAPDIAVITGGAGIGKTMACNEYKLRAPNVWLVTCQPCFRSLRDLLEEIARTIGLHREFRTTNYASEIITKTRGSGGLLIIDEANHLSSEGLDQLRTLHDLAGVGIALVGNEIVISRLEGDGRRAQFAQLYRRVGMRLSRSAARTADINTLLNAWQIEAERERGMLRAIARKPGALGNVTKTLRLAFMQASAAGRELVSPADIANAWKQISNTSIPEETA